MKRMLAVLVLAVSAALSGQTQAAAAATPDAEALLKRVFDNYRANSSEATMTMTIHRPDWERAMQMKTWTRGENDALVRFLAPAKDAGNASLKMNTDMWVFNPKLNQVIKLPPSMMAQSWMGSDFSYNDMAKSEDLLTLYTHKTVGTETTGGHTVWTIDAVPKPGAPVIWGKVQLKMRDDDVMVEETFFDQDMKPARKMTTEKIGPLGGRPYPLVMTMRTLDMPGQWTRIETQDGKFNATLPAYLFTLSNLQNPRG